MSESRRLMPHMGARMASIIADHDRGPEYVLVECMDCQDRQRIDGSVGRPYAEIRAEFEAMGWTISPTRCPECAATHRRLTHPFEVTP